MPDTNTVATRVTDDAVWPHVGAYVLLSGGLTMVFLAASTIISSPVVAIPGLVAPAVVALGLGTQRRVDVRQYLGVGVRPGVTAVSAAFGPFAIVLAMVIAGQPRRPAGDSTVIWAVILAALAEIGWWGYLYPLLRHRIQPLQAAIVVGLVRVAWHGLLAWAGTNPLAGAAPQLLGVWSLVLSLLTAAILEFHPRSIVPVALLYLGLDAAVGMLGFAPADAGTSLPMRIGTALLLVAGLVTMVIARGEAVRGARHARLSR